MIRLDTPPGISAWYSELSDGNMSLSRGDTAANAAGRRAFCSAAGMSIDDLVCPHQVHGQRIVRVSRAHRGKGALSAADALADTDALICNEPGIACCVQTADCLPVFLYDPRSRSVGIVHAGWRSTQLQLVAATVRAMQQAFGADPAGMYAWFGPCLQECCYEVGEEFCAYFPNETVRRGATVYFDNPAANRRQLCASGVREERISAAGACTGCHPARFFSHRRQGDQAGHMLSVISIV